MTNAPPDEIIRVEAPLSEALLDELLPFWFRHLGTSYGDFRRELSGSETNENLEAAYLMRVGDTLVGAIRMTVSRSHPEVAAIGLVATETEFRGRGIATAMCSAAVKDFQRGGGRCLFLVSGNPVTRRIYHRLGWRKMAGTGVMGCVTSGDSPEEFLVDYFRVGGRAAVQPGTAWERVPMIPLHLNPHDWQVLDANVGEFSTRYCSRKYCNTLYPAYEKLAEDGRGAWFAARTDTDRLVGLSSTRMADPDRCRIDGFAHHRYMNSWPGLMEAAMGWGAQRGVSVLEATLSVEDEEKRALFSSLGFVETERGRDFDFDGRMVASVMAEKAI